MHLIAAREGSRRLLPEGLLAIDDTWMEAGAWSGKGALAVPWLLEQGWRMLEAAHRAVLFYKGSELTAPRLARISINTVNSSKFIKMKAVILAGGLGTRISEETHLKPKPMIEIGGKPILWHILKTYSHHGINQFIICCGYKGYVIKEYFANYFLHMADVTFHMKLNSMEVHHRKVEPWQVTVVDTGETSMTGGRLRRVREFIGDETFCFTYGDGVSDVDIRALIEFHHQNGRQATLTAVQPPGRYGALQLEADGSVCGFQEKPEGDGGWINGGFFVLEPEVINRIEGDATIWEQEPLKTLARDGQLSAYHHGGFWQPMDTLRDRTLLEELWSSGKAPWKVW